MAVPRIALLLAAILAVPLTAASSVPGDANAAGYRSAADNQTAPPATATGGDAGEAAKAAETARRTGKPVEIESERTETTTVYANPSGNRTLESYAVPIRARKNGGWAPIDTNLSRNPDGSVSPGATVTGLRISGGGTGPVVTATENGTELSLSWPTALPAPVLSGDTATYPEVLPGVDLQIRATVSGFAQALVVKTPAAARNPALQRIRFKTATKGLTLRTGPDGSSTAVDATGRAVFAAGTPTMWDSTPEPPDAVEGQPAPLAADPAATGPKEKAIGLEYRPGELTVVPDQGMLSAPTTRYPVYIDPSYSSAQYIWTMVNKTDPEGSYWSSSYREDVRVGKVWGLTQGPWRAFFQMRVTPAARATVSRAWFSITVTHVAECAGNEVELWHTKLLDPTKSLTWNNSGPNWLDGKAIDTPTVKANKSCSPPTLPKLVEFGVGFPVMTNLVQDAVNGPAGPQEAIGFGLRNPYASEGSQYYWKRFDITTARLIIEYNTPPRAPTGVTTVPPTPCGTASAPTPLKTTQPIFAGVGFDPNGDNVTNTLEVLSGETVLTTLTSAVVGSGSATQWQPVSEGTLPGNQPSTVFSYRARTTDTAPVDPTTGRPTALTGPYSARCYFTVDTARPGTPTISSTDFPSGSPVRSVGETGTLTFVRAAGDTDVAGFRYGFSQDAVTMWAAADANGTAMVPVTLWPSTPGDTNDVTRNLFVRAIDRYGNGSVLAPVWTLVARGRAVTTPAVRGDVNGDRRADVGALIQLDGQRTTAWNVVSRQGGFYAGYIGWDTDVTGGFPPDRMTSVSGDFDGDGRTDMAIYREDPGPTLRLFLLHSDGTRYEAASEPVWSGTGFRVSHFKVVAGDFDADGDDDIAALQGLAGGQSKLWIQTSNSGQFGNPVMVWDSGVNGLALAQADPLAGDFDGDGDDDVAYVYDAGGSRARLMLLTSNAGQFSAPVQKWDSGVGAFAAVKARFVAADVDGATPRDDEVVALYDDGAATSRLMAIADNGGVWSASTWWSSGTGGFDATRATLTAGDFDGDGRADAAALFSAGNGIRRLYTFASTGTGFGGQQLRWEGMVGDLTPKVTITPGRLYRIQPTHTNKCLDVPGGKADNALAIDQWDCTTATWEMFGFQQLGASPYFQVKTGPGKCLEMQDWSLLDNTKLVQQPCADQADQQFLLEYLGGTGLDTEVQIRNVHTDRCLQVAGAGTANGAGIVQVACSTAPPANQRFYLRVEP